MPYVTLYVILGLCIAALALVAQRLYRQHTDRLRHDRSLHRQRKSHRADR